MPKKKSGSSGLETATPRLALPAQKAPHRHRLDPGLSIGYYRSFTPDNDGTWMAIAYDPKATPKESRKHLGKADDYTAADGVKVLDWKQAQEAARTWRKAAQEPQEVKMPVDTTWTVDRAWDEYLKDCLGRGVAGATKIMPQCYDAWIRPVLGHIAMADLTKLDIRNWLLFVANSPRRNNKKPPKEYKRKFKVPREPKPTKPTKADLDPRDTERARKNTANRQFGMLKGALNFVVDNDLVLLAHRVWDSVKPFPKVTSNRTRVLDMDEQRRLIAACEETLRPLVIAGLFTGARYGELASALVKDLQPQHLHVEWGKGKGDAVSRNIALLPDAIEWFQKLVKGKRRNELLFKRGFVVRTTRAEALQGREGWEEGDQIYAMECAVERAGIDPVTFHELRHTYATNLINLGMPLKHVAKQLGHVDTRMVEQHYGHVGDKDVKDALDKLRPEPLLVS